MSSICLLTNSEGETVKKILDERLAKSWGLVVLFTGTHEECLQKFNT